MWKTNYTGRALCLAFVLNFWLVGCGGSGKSAEAVAVESASQLAPPTPANPPATGGVVTLPVAPAAPTPPATEPELSQTQGIARTLQIEGLEDLGARLEYSLDDQKTWFVGAGSSLSVLGNGFSKIWLRRLDVAGSRSTVHIIELDTPANYAWIEASGDPLLPSVLSTAGSNTFLIHGSVVRNDADYIRWDIPVNHQMTSVRLVHYVSNDSVAFYALQNAREFNAGFDTSKMLVFDHMGPDKLAVNVVSEIPKSALGAGPVTLWFQQTGSSPTVYAIEVTIQRLQ